MEFMGMPLGAALFLGVVLLGFAVLDITMLVSLLRMGDERGHIIVWKTSTFAFNAMVGGLVLNVITNYATKQPMTINPFIQLQVAAILYCLALLYYRKKLGRQLAGLGPGFFVPSPIYRDI